MSDGYIPIDCPKERELELRRFKAKNIKLERELEGYRRYLERLARDLSDDAANIREYLEENGT